jgi:hypothetical protein
MSTTSSLLAAISLRDRVIIILALAAQRGTNRIWQGSIYDLFFELQEHFPGAFNDVGFRIDGGQHYSRQIDAELMHWNGAPLHSTMDGYWLMEPDSADHMIELMTERYGSETIGLFTEVVDHFIESVAKYIEASTIARDL